MGDTEILSLSQLRKLRVADLRDRLQALGLSTAGKTGFSIYLKFLALIIVCSLGLKAELVDRLYEAYGSRGKGVPEPASGPFQDSYPPEVPYDHVPPPVTDPSYPVVPTNFSTSSNFTEPHVPYQNQQYHQPQPPTHYQHIPQQPINYPLSEVAPSYPHMAPAPYEQPPPPQTPPQYPHPFEAPHQFSSPPQPFLHSSEPFVPQPPPPSEPFMPPQEYPSQPQTAMEQFVPQSVPAYPPPPIEQYTPYPNQGGQINQEERYPVAASERADAPQEILNFDDVTFGAEAAFGGETSFGSESSFLEPPHLNEVHEQHDNSNVQTAPNIQINDERTNVSVNNEPQTIDPIKKESLNTLSQNIPEIEKSVSSLPHQTLNEPIEEFKIDEDKPVLELQDDLSNDKKEPFLEATREIDLPDLSVHSGSSTTNEEKHENLIEEQIPIKEPALPKNQDNFDKNIEKSSFIAGNDNTKDLETVQKEISPEKESQNFINEEKQQEMILKENDKSQQQKNIGQINVEPKMPKQKLSKNQKRKLRKKRKGEQKRNYEQNSEIVEDDEDKMDIEDDLEEEVEIE